MAGDGAGGGHKSQGKKEGLVCCAKEFLFLFFKARNYLLVLLTGVM